MSSEEGERELARFIRLDEATPEDYRLITAQFNRVASPDQQADRMLNLLRMQRGVDLAQECDLYEHALQTATRAHRDGADEELTVVALLHDVGELVTPTSHGEISAGMLRPYISPQNWWILMHHEIFQFAYYSEAAGCGSAGEKARAIFEASPHFEACKRFCERYDQMAFDPDYESLPLEFFEPMVRRIVSRDPFAHPDHQKEDITRAKRSMTSAYPDSGL
jgi:predicted HD phosphohydrolase